MLVCVTKEPVLVHPVSVLSKLGLVMEAVRSVLLSAVNKLVEAVVISVVTSEL